MYWDKLPPQSLEGCVYRTLADRSSGAVCELLVAAGIPRAYGQVPRDACAACCLHFPPAPGLWNPVVASLIYSACRRVLNCAKPDAVERTQFLRLQEQALEQLPAADEDALPVQRGSGDLPPPAALSDLLPPARRRGRSRVRRWAVGVVCAPRRQATLGVTLDSLMRAGWNDPCLFLDGAVRIPPRFSHLAGVLREPRAGCWPNYYLALSEMLMRYPDADAYLLAEDDVLFYDAESMREYLEQMLWPGSRRCIVSLYCSSENAARKWGWRPITKPWGLGALAFVFPRRVAQELLLDPRICDYRWGHWHEEGGGMASTDIVIGKWAWRKKIRIWFPTPSLVQHIGVTSTLRHDLLAAGNRRADPWVGSVIRGQPEKR
jgi:hypothetical protein